MLSRVTSFESFLKLLTRAAYIALPIYIAGFVTLGAGLQYHLSPAVLVIGWGMALVAVMINTVMACKFQLICKLN